MVHLDHALGRVRLGAIVLGLCLAGADALAQAAQGTTSTPLSYQAAIQRALTANPAIIAARLRRSINIASRDVAAERLNPEVRAELAKETPKEAYTLAVPWETGGKRARRIAVGDAAILTGDAELNATIAQVQAEVRRTYFDGFVAVSRQSLLADVQSLAQRARDAAQARFDTGDAPKLEVVQAELVLADAENQATAAAGTVIAARTTLNALLGFPLDAPTAIETTFDVAPALSVDAALARARQANAELAVFDRRLEEQRARVSLAQAMRTPDITTEGTLTHRAEPEFDFGWRAAFAVTLPLFASHQAGVTLEQATLTQLTREREAALARISGEVTAAAAIAAAQRQQYLRYRDQILPQTMDVERMAEDAYRLGQTNIGSYLQALQSTRDVRLRALQAAADLQSALADLERAIGEPPPTPPDAGPGPAKP
jgi:outer membrane protein TolC